MGALWSWRQRMGVDQPAKWVVPRASRGLVDPQQRELSSCCESLHARSVQSRQLLRLPCCFGALRVLLHFKFLLFARRAEIFQLNP